MRNLKALPVLVVILLVLLTASFAGCKPAETPAEPAATEAPAEAVSEQPVEKATEAPTEPPVEAVVWKWTTTETEGTPYWDEWTSIFADLEERTGGELKVEMYPLGAITDDEMEMLQGVQQGSIECAQISATIFSNIAPEYDVLNLPFLIDDFEHMERFNDTPECKELLAMLEPYGIKQYRLGNIGFAFPNSKEPVKAVEDFKNVKWRTMSATMQLDTMKALGAVPVTIPYGDVYNALKTGLVDGWHNAGSAFVALSTYEAAPYVTQLPLFSWPGTFIVNIEAYNKLSEENKQIFDEVMNERLTNGFKSMHDYNMDALDDLVAEGKMELITVDDFAPFREKIASVYDAYFEANPTFKVYYDAIDACR